MCERERERERERKKEREEEEGGRTDGQWWRGCFRA